MAAQHWMAKHDMYDDAGAAAAAATAAEATDVATAADAAVFLYGVQ